MLIQKRNGSQHGMTIRGELNISSDGFTAIYWLRKEQKNHQIPQITQYLYMRFISKSLGCRERLS
jgi:hypothetical protein